MGSKKETQSTNNTQTYQASATPMESQINQQLQNNLNATLPAAGQSQASYLDLLNKGANAYTGGVSSAGLNGTPLGMAIGGVTPEQQDSIVKQSMRYLSPQFQNGGYLNSGAAASIESRTAADLLGQSAQFNVTNSGNVLQALMNGNYNAQNVTGQNANQLSSNLAGLRSITQTNNGTVTNKSMNPFLMGLETGAGNSLGSGMGAMATGGLGAGTAAAGGMQNPAFMNSLQQFLNPNGAPSGFGNTFGVGNVTNSNPFRIK